jgi:hypothetical protein
MHLYQINYMILRFSRLCVIVSLSELEPIYSYLTLVLIYAPDTPPCTTDDADIFAEYFKTKVQYCNIHKIHR